MIVFLFYSGARPGGGGGVVSSETLCRTASKITNCFLRKYLLWSQLAEAADEPVPAGTACADGLHHIFATCTVLTTTPSLPGSQYMQQVFQSWYCSFRQTRLSSCFPVSPSRPLLPSTACPTPYYFEMLEISVSLSFCGSRQTHSKTQCPLQGPGCTCCSTIFLDAGTETSVASRARSYKH